MDPPAYEPLNAGPSRSTLPAPEAQTGQRARAPLRLERTNHQIKETFSVDCQGLRQEAVFLKTINGKIESKVILHGTPEVDALQVTAETTNGALRLALEISEKQTLHAKLTSINGACEIQLPEGYNGSVLCCTINAKATLGPSLKACSVQVPLRDNEPKEATRYEVNGGGPSHFDIETTNASIKVGFAGDADKDRSCVIA